jgi:hypothetical protein
MQAPAHSLAYTKTAVERAFGATSDELFDDFPAVPVASGSIGQVTPAEAELWLGGLIHTPADLGQRALAAGLLPSAHPCSAPITRRTG